MKQINIDGVKIDIPNWVNEEAKIYILAGQELFAVLTRKSDGVHVEVKEVLCNRCGQCCRTTPYEDWKGNLYCKYLRDNLCSLRLARPFVCCITVPKGIEQCSLRFKTVGVIKEDAH